MNALDLVTAGVTVLVFAYLVWALLRAEEF
jgi:K+-transporting ATPase KdpF subunit